MGLVTFNGNIAKKVDGTIAGNCDCCNPVTENPCCVRDKICVTFTGIDFCTPWCIKCTGGPSQKFSAVLSNGVTFELTREAACDEAHPNDCSYRLNNAFGMTLDTYASDDCSGSPTSSGTKLFSIVVQFTGGVVNVTVSGDLSTGCFTDQDGVVFSSNGNVPDTIPANFDNDLVAGDCSDTATPRIVAYGGSVHIAACPGGI